MSSSCARGGSGGRSSYIPGVQIGCIGRGKGCGKVAWAIDGSAKCLIIAGLCHQLLPLVAQSVPISPVQAAPAGLLDPAPAGPTPTPLIVPARNIICHPYTQIPVIFHL